MSSFDLVFSNRMDVPIYGQQFWSTDVIALVEDGYSYNTACYIAELWRREDSDSEREYSEPSADESSEDSYPN